jgi:hypothetical protein
MGGAFGTIVEVQRQPTVTGTPLIPEDALLDQGNGGKTNPIMGFTEHA